MKITRYFNLDRDKLEDTEAIESIIQGVQFKGSSLWILVCAIVIASLGLNMNSTAVIIGAMLISPLMGPIMGIGLGLGINDMPLVHRCVKNLVVATVISLIASSIYFYLSPINEARSELLARTQPTLYDVLIAFFGGFAGIIATGSRSKGNILPGVAIATALMPPLCTAGYGLATAQWSFFLGAFYLYLINAVYIGLATWLGCLVLKLPKINAPVNPAHRWGFASLLLVALIVPSGFTTVKLIHGSVQDGKVAAFVRGEFSELGETQLVSYQFVSTDSVPLIEVALLGEPLSNDHLNLIASHIPFYGLPDDCRLKVVQGSAQQEVDVNELSQGIVQGIVHSYHEQLLRLQRENDSLRNELRVLEQRLSPDATDSVSTLVIPSAKR